jgi:uncharacterized membrane protein YqiK
MLNLVSQVLEPTIGNYFRNSAQSSDIISFLTDRKKRQDDAKTQISMVLEEYNVHAVDTLIGDINPPESLMKTLTDRKIAAEEKETYKIQQGAEEQRKTLESAKSLADIQGKMVAAQQSVEIAQREAEATVKSAEGSAKAMELNAKAQSNANISLAEAEAKKTRLIGEAEAAKIEAIGKSTAESYKLQVQAMGGDNFAKFKITEEIGKNNIRIIPEVLINGGNGTDGSMNGLMGLKLMEMMGADSKIETKTK